MRVHHVCWERGGMDQQGGTLVIDEMGEIPFLRLHVDEDEGPDIFYS